MTRLYRDTSKLALRVCGGMHCAPLGGGKPLLEAIEQALISADLLDRVELTRAHCLGECADGPCVRVGMERFYHVTQADVPQIIQSVQNQF